VTTSEGFQDALEQLLMPISLESAITDGMEQDCGLKNLPVDKYLEDRLAD
jgi:hypothetical protein